MGAGSVFGEDDLRALIALPSENERVEFKEAKQSYSKEKVRKYCVTLANGGGGHLVLGVSDIAPRQIVGTRAFESADSLNELKRDLRLWLNLLVEVYELSIEGKRALVFDVPSRPQGRPLEVDGAYLTRVGESILPMTPDQLKAILNEGDPGFLEGIARSGLSPADVVALLDTQRLFDLLGVPYPTSQSGVLERLDRERLVAQGRDGTWAITNMGALVMAKSLSAISADLARKAPRLIIYSGRGRTTTSVDQFYDEGFAACFARLVDFVHDAAPRNQVVEESLRQDVRMFPRQAIRELVANAFVHQDFGVSGARLMIEMFDDRVEISNPGLPPIEVDRFIDEYLSRNETLADLLRRFGVCEEKGSGIDKVVGLAEVYQLPAPRFHTDSQRTKAVIFAHKDFGDMVKEDRIRACYQHCCLMWVTNRTMTNQSLRERFGLSGKQMATASQIINHTKAAGLIRDEDRESRSTRYARYLPYWA